MNKIFVLIFFCVLHNLAYGGPYDNPPAVPGFTHSEVLSPDTPGKHGIILSGGNVTYSASVIGEIDGDSSDGLEVAVGGAGGRVYAYKADGTLLWSVNTPNATCGTAGNRLLSSPAVGNLLGDGVPYVVVGYGGIGDSCDGGVIAIHGPSGNISWTFSTSKFATRQSFWARYHAVFSTPALADTDSDGRLEIGFGSFDRNVYLLNADGTVRWYYNAADTVWSSGAFADVNNDGVLEFVIGTDISQNRAIQPPTQNGGFVYAFKTAARSKKHIYFRDPTAYLWKRYLGQVIFSSPVVAEVLQSNAGLEVIVGSGCFFPQSSTNKSGRWAKVLSASTGQVLQTLNAPACFPSSVAVGDIDNDDVNEIVASVNGDRSIGGHGNSRLVAWKASSADPLWSVIPRTRGVNDHFVGHFNSPVIADLDGNGSMEVLLSNMNAVDIFKGRDGTALTCADSTCTNSLLMLYAWRSLRSTPAVADIDNDGLLDVVVAGGHSSAGGHGAIYAWTGFPGLLGSDVETPSASYIQLAWPMHRGNAQRQGVFPAP